MSYIFEEASQKLIDTFESVSQTDEYTDIIKHLNLFTVEVALKAFFGINLESDNRSKNMIISSVTKILRTDISFTQIISVIFPVITKFFPIGFVDVNASNYLIGLTEKIIDERNKYKIRIEDVLQYLLDGDGHQQNGSEKMCTKSSKFLSILLVENQLLKYD